jgi:hypothetical protein
MMYLRKNLQQINVSKEEREKLIRWTKKTKANVDDVAKIIEDKKWRKSNQLNF